LDGAHNPAGIATLSATLKQHFPGRKPAIIFGVLRDKDYDSMCRLLAPLADRLCLTPVSSERTADPEILRRICKEAEPAVRIEVFSSLSETLKNVRNDSLVVVTGSLHFIGEAMELLQISPWPASNERGLNEWTAKPREA
jgi:dihydrofolate synthase/folylpolyglutamate synthase